MHLPQNARQYVVDADGAPHVKNNVGRVLLEDLFSARFTAIIKIHFFRDCRSKGPRNVWPIFGKLLLCLAPRK